MAARGRKSVEQIAVISRHDDDKNRIKDFSNTLRSKEKLEGPEDAKSMCCCMAFTTLNTTIYLFGIATESTLTGTSLYSKDIHNPWFITEYTEELPRLADFIRAQWNAMEVRGDQERVDSIAHYIVYDATDLEKEPQLVALECDENDNVRANIDDITIWSQPPRDEPLYEALTGKYSEDDKKKYDQKIRNVKSCARNWKELQDEVNEEVPHKEILEEQRQRARDEFNELYSAYYEKLTEFPDSYKLPRLQFQQRIPPSTGIKPTTFATLFSVALLFLYSAFCSSNSLLFSLVFSSILFLSFLYYYFKVYPHPEPKGKQHSDKTQTDVDDYANEAHIPFPASDVKPRDSKKDVFDQLVGQEFGMEYDDIMASD